MSAACDFCGLEATRFFVSHYRGGKTFFAEVMALRLFEKAYRAQLAKLNLLPSPKMPVGAALSRLDALRKDPAR